MPVYLVIAVVAAVFALMGLHTVLTKQKNPLWGAVVPVLIAAAGIYFWFFRNIALSYKNIMVFAIPLAWCLIECYRGRKRRLAEAEKEIRKNEGSGYPAIKKQAGKRYGSFPACFARP